MDRRYNQPYDYRFRNSGSFPSRNSPYDYDQNYDYDEYDSYDPRAQERPRSFPSAAQQEEVQRGGEGSGQVIREEEKEGGQRSTMASWFQRAAGSQQAQFAATALVSGAVVAGAI